MSQYLHPHIMPPLRLPVAYETLAPSPESLAADALAYLDDMPSLSIPPVQAPPATASSEGIRESGETHLDKHTPGGGWNTPQRRQQGFATTPPTTPPHDTLSADCTFTEPVVSDSFHLGLTSNEVPEIVVQGPEEELTTAVAPSPLPSLLRYVDNHLMRDKERHDKPPNAEAKCPICRNIHNKAPMKTTFFPLSPCGCWVHYRCFIWWTSLDSPDHNRCPVCKIALFLDEGITTLTLTARTDLKLQDAQWPLHTHYVDNDTGLDIFSHYTEYAAECAHIEFIINRNFFHALTLPSPFEDKSPDLTMCYYAVLDDLERYRSVRSKWLSWSSPEGYLMYGMLVACKMRRYLEEKQTGVVGTEGWVGFVHGMGVLQGKILEKVHDEDGLQAKEGESAERMIQEPVEVSAREMEGVQFT